MKQLLFLLVIFSVCISNYAMAQKNYSEGYIVTADGDTLHGKVRDNHIFKIRKKIQFMSNDGGKKTYTIKKLKAYSKSDIVDYVVIKQGLERHFARIVIDGKIRLLIVKYHGTVAGPGHSGTPHTYNYDNFFLYNTEDNKLKKHQLVAFSTWAAEYFADCGDLVQKIENKELRHSDIEIIVQKYNECAGK